MKHYSIAEIQCQLAARLNLSDLWKREMRVWGFRLTAPSLDRLVCLGLHRLRLMGKLEKQLFPQWIRAGMTVVDIGANQGLYALLFSQLVGASGHVLAFEPEPDMFAALVHNCALNSAKNIECIELALGASAGIATLARSLVHAGDNRLATVHGRKIIRSVNIQVAPLDEVIGERTVDFIKIDVQGWEWEVFRGMQRTLERNRDIQIYFEFWPQGLRNAGCNPAEMLADLRDRGFYLFEHVNGEERPVSDNNLASGWTGQRFTNIYARR
ncbi:MAG: FkbM family methyltransferase [Acidobacteriaceae bacterium]|nr:FkbM family methyltransferase [Acidobacteriaceae bacterium]